MNAMRALARSLWFPALLGLLLGLLIISAVSCTNEMSPLSISDDPRDPATTICSRSGAWDDSSHSCTPEWSSVQIAPYNATSRLGVIRAHVEIVLPDTVVTYRSGLVELVPDVDAALYVWQRWRKWQNPGHECDLISCHLALAGCDTTRVRNFYDARLYPYERAAFVNDDGVATFPNLANGFPALCATRYLLNFSSYVEYTHRGALVRARLVGVATFTASTQRETIDVRVTQYPLAQQLP